MVGITLAEVEGFLDGRNDVSFNPIGKSSAGDLRSNAPAVSEPCLTTPLTILGL